MSTWPSTAQPTAVATSGESNPSREIRAAGNRSRPQNQIMYAAAVPTSDRYAYPARFAEVSVAGSPSTATATGASSSPPAVSCQPVVVSSEVLSGRPQRLVSTSPSDIDAVPPSPASSPTGSSPTTAVSTVAATPPAPATAATTVRSATRSVSSSAVSPATNRGAAAPSTAAIPPGSR
ncbi:hypothetical protein Adi01nite_47370 [Amorphoplanes digitatis]|nr:hypothetical protein Adi01nite_47370 [Actinoplanes digitatis]